MVVEGLRTDSLYFLKSVLGETIRVSQMLSVLLVITGIVLLIVFRKRDDNLRNKEDKILEAENV